MTIEEMDDHLAAEFNNYEKECDGNYVAMRTFLVINLICAVKQHYPKAGETAWQIWRANSKLSSPEYLP